MTRTVTGVFKDTEAARNAADDLISAGFDREKVYVEKGGAEVKVIVPATVEREVKDILDRHRPTEVSSH